MLDAERVNKIPTTGISVLIFSLSVFIVYFTDIPLIYSFPLCIMFIGLYSLLSSIYVYNNKPQDKKYFFNNVIKVQIFWGYIFLLSGGMLFITYYYKKYVVLFASYLFLLGVYRIIAQFIWISQTD